MRDSLNTTLEELIDWHGLDAVLRGLADTCSEKADHLRSAWQDEPLAQHWQQAADFIDGVRGKIDV